MTAVPPLEAIRQPAKPRKKARRFNHFPLIGVLLAIVVAVLTYGGLFLLLADGWSASSPVEYVNPSKAPSPPAG